MSGMLAIIGMILIAASLAGILWRLIHWSDAPKQNKFDVELWKRTRQR